uniref:platelet-activating factor acetylhydrolase-like n=1 Tax=Ciona intestinalis TaxID=7719 RepID=UPI000180C884|nr:platelet-activating factor acetylhydrolase-like [Ciona intestinalis]|eukprot:XP_026690770.1 platelet-activating factor acetylhydrolase-like [Ciona intestinalis]
MRQLPKPSGPFQVGSFDITTKYGEDRCLFRMYYPTKQFDSAFTEGPLWFPCHEYAAGFTNVMKIPSLSRLFGWFFSGLRIPVAWNGDLQMPKSVDKLPVVLLSHGLACNKTTCSNVCTDLASYGTLVASIEHSDKSASATYYFEEKENEVGEKIVEKKWLQYHRVSGGEPAEQEHRNKQVRHRAAECCKILDTLQLLNEGNLKTVEGNENLYQFKNALDLEKCAVLGHSFGGGTAVATLSMDERFKVGIGLDSWMYPLDQKIYTNIKSVPFLFINSENYQWAESVEDMRKLDSDTFDIEAERKIITLAGTSHLSQTDFALFVKSRFIAKLIHFTGTAEPLGVAKLNNEIVRAFIGKHLGLEFGRDLESLIQENEDGIIRGSNLKLDESKIEESKEALRELKRNEL